MKKQDVLSWIKRTKIVPVIRAKSPEDGFKIVEALLDGGIDVLEITMTVPGAVELIEKVSDKFGDRALVGAGTVYNELVAENCMLAGAQFIVGPCTDRMTIEACRFRGVLVAPGALTPSEVVAAKQLGADLIKIFPCDAAGGPGYIKSLKAPFPDIDFMPTGGVSLTNANDFLKAGAIAVGVGNALVDPQLVEENRFDDIAERAKAFIAAAAEQ